jgi:hypothetical protein
MLVLIINLESTEIEEELDVYSRGHITFQDGNTILSSQDLFPNQSMMIFIALVELLNGIRLFIVNSNKQEYNFVGTDCSFQFFMLKEGINQVAILDSKKKIIFERINTLNLIKIVWDSIASFWVKYSCYLDKEESIYKDITASIEKFKQQFDLNR